MREIPFEELKINPLTLIGDQWMLLSAGNEQDGCRTMTISWGSLGSLWHLPGRKAFRGLPTATVYVRPQRYTKEYIDSHEYFTLSVMPEKYRKEVTYLGRVSARDEDKIAKSGLTPVYADGTVYFKDAILVLVCRKIFHSAMKEEDFLDPAIIDESYPQKDFHDIYIGEIVKTLVC